jgi:uncharacterized protein (TIGR00369 family)
MSMTLEAAITRFKEAPFMQHLGITPTRVEDGVLHADMKVKPWMLQATGVCHAGIVTALGDHVAAASARLASGVEHSLVTIELKSNFMRPAVGKKLRAEGVPVKVGRTLMFAESLIFAVDDGGDEELCAKVHVTVFGGKTDRPQSRRD